MADDFYDEDLIILLTIDGTQYEKIEVKVTDPNKTIRDQINSIVQVFKLSKSMGGGYVTYLLGIERNAEEEAEILDLEDDNGREQCLLDYNIQNGDHLHLVAVPLCGRPKLTLELNLICDEDGTGFDLNSVEKIEIFIGSLWNQEVKYLIRYIVEKLNLPLLYRGSYIEYSLSYWDKDKGYIECYVCRELSEYMHILINQDTDMSLELRMRLSAEISHHRNYICFLFEKWHRNLGKYLCSNFLIMK